MNSSSSLACYRRLESKGTEYFESDLQDPEKVRELFDYCQILLVNITKRIKFGCSYDVLPRWYPIRLAEDFAMVDILTGGRVVFGIGRGYHFEEHVKFAAPPGMLRYNDQQMEATGPGGAARHIAAGTNFRDVIQKRAWWAGTPEETVDYLKEIEHNYPGLEQIMVAFPLGATVQQFKNQMTRFAKEVMPAFGKSGVTA